MENQLIIALKSIGVFDDVVYSSLDYENFVGNLITVQEGKILFRENEEANEFYLLISGKIKLLDKDIEDEDSVIKDKALIGALDVIKNGTFKASAIVLTDSYLIKISKEEINYLINQNNKIYENIEKLCSSTKKEDDITKLFKLDLSTNNLFANNSSDEVLENKKLTLGELGKINLVDDDKDLLNEEIVNNEIEDFNDFVKNNADSDYNLSNFLQEKMNDELNDNFSENEIPKNILEAELETIVPEIIEYENKIIEDESILEDEPKTNTFDSFTFDPKEFENIASEFSNDKIDLEKNLIIEDQENEIDENSFPPIEDNDALVFGEDEITENEKMEDFKLDISESKLNLIFVDDNYEKEVDDEKIDEEVEFKFDLKDLEKEIKLFNQNFEEDEILKKISNEEFNIAETINDVDMHSFNEKENIELSEQKLDNFIVEDKDSNDNQILDFGNENDEKVVNFEENVAPEIQILDEKNEDFVNFLKENNLSIYQENETLNPQETLDYEIKFENLEVNEKTEEINTVEDENNLIDELGSFNQEFIQESIILNPDDFKTKIEEVSNDNIQTNDYLSKISIEEKKPVENFYDFEEKNQLIIDDVNINEPLVEDTTEINNDVEEDETIENENLLETVQTIEPEIKFETDGFILDSEEFLKQMGSLEENKITFTEEKPVAFEEPQIDEIVNKEEVVYQDEIIEATNEVIEVVEENDLSKENGYIKKIMKAAELINSNIKLDDVLVDIVNAATEMTESDRGTLYILDKEKNELWSKVAMGSEPKEIRLAIGQGIAGWVAKTNEIVNLKDATQDERFNPEYDKNSGYETQSMLCVPIRNKNTETVGVLQLLNSKNGEFRKIDEELLETISIYCSIALENAKLVEKLLQGERELSLGKMANFLIQDIKKPTLVTKRYAEHLRNKDLSNDINQVLEMMLEQINYVADLVQTTSNYAEGSTLLRTTERGAREVLDEFCAKIESTVKARKVTILPNFDNTGRIKIDPKEFYQCFNHIIKNACDAMPEGGEIRITTFVDNGFVKIKFKDQGLGIPEALIDKIFEPLMSYGKKDGTGLGLSVTKKIIEDHGGKIEVKSELGVGTEVIVSLPEVSF